VVAGLNPVKLLVNVPVPVPVVTLKVDEPELVPQTSPREVTVVPPSKVIVPPLVAVVPVIEVTVSVAETVGAVSVVKVTSGP
jgi:hypothetical protein